ncbi:hypothetical protein SAMN05216255_3043 [Pseudomonas segetis]|uniref:Uncharacterized protein n=1 Tax=Pseudomonas segetis TaxID=298908 RepID=A0A239GLZ0_9PSED|nr:hypothetical protein SAMN05216255_3043 [Pseudomonas segetis]
MLARQDRVLLVWGAFDAFYVARFVVTSLSEHRIPYVTDFTETLRVLSEQGAVVNIYVMFMWVLQASIVVSALLLLARKPGFKWFYYCQIPLRLIYYVPSVSLITLGVLGPQGSRSIAITLGLLLLSEALKVFTLFKYVPSKKSV